MSDYWGVPPAGWATPATTYCQRGMVEHRKSKSIHHQNHPVNVVEFLLTAGSFPMVLRNFWPILDDFLLMECMFSLEIFLVSVRSSSVLYLSTEKENEHSLNSYVSSSSCLFTISIYCPT